jgi:hypothetical protein
MDILLEAFEAHSIEQLARKAKYEGRFEKEMDEKIDKWNEIYKNYEEGKLPSHEQIRFMIQEGKISLDSSLSEEIPYLRGHIDRLKEEHKYYQAIKLFQEILPRYHQFLESVKEMYTPILGKKKKLTSIIERAKHLQEDTKDISLKLEKFLNREHQFEEEWEKEWNEDKKKLTKIEEKHRQSLQLTEEEIKWLMSFSRYSIREQMDTGELFFAHHFKRVERESSFRKEIEECKKVFHTYKQAIEEIANLSVERFFITDTLEKTSIISRKAIHRVDWEYYNLQRKWNKSA